MTDSLIYPVNPIIAERAHLNKQAYQALYAQSISHPEAFWAAQAERFLHWTQPWYKVMECDFHTTHIRWFAGAKLNVSENCLDRHLATQGDKLALIWEGDEPSQTQRYTYRQLHQQVCQFANVLKAQGVTAGDTVCLYLPMIPEAAIAMLACTRIGAVHSIVFAGFSAEALKDRVQDGRCRTLICTDEAYRGGKTIAIKTTVDNAAQHCPELNTIIVIRHSGQAIPWQAQRDFWYHELMATANSDCPPTPMDAEAPLFILYTSGSTGKPKGVLHTTGGYLLYAAMTHYYVFDYQDDDVYWCSADIGWITGHSYSIYGPLCNGATTVLFAGVPTYPEADRYWQIIDKYKVTVFYTAPTALRALMAQGNDWVLKTQRTSLRLLGSVGEPINTEAWEWYYHVVGDARCPIVDTWWQTETGGILITPLPGATDLKPGSASLPFFGIHPVIMDTQGRPIEGVAEGVLALSQSWPGQARSLYGDHPRFINTYFKAYPGYYFTGDGARRDEDGYYWITGRVDDVLNVSGHRLGTAEIESAINLHPDVAESAVVGVPHDIKWQGIYAFVTLNLGTPPHEELRHALNMLVKQEIGGIAGLDYVQWASALPKTRSGKIMRRILRKIAANEVDSLGDLSTLAEPSVVAQLITERLTRN